MPRTRGIIAAAALTAAVTAALAATAVAYPRIESYNVRDAGARIVHRIDWCTGYVPPGREWRTLWTTRVESDNGRDVHVDNWGGWYDRGCWTTRLSYRDLLDYEGPYYGRVRLVFGPPRFRVFTDWDEFWSS